MSRPDLAETAPMRLLVVLAVVLLAVLVHDLVQRRHAVLRTFPVVGHLRFLLEAVGPELRQCIVTDNDAERPFSRDQRRWIYASAKGPRTGSPSGPTTTSTARPGTSS